MRDASIVKNINNSFRNLFQFLLGIDKRERVKVAFLTVSFFSVIGAYTVIRELKDSIFISLVGKEYIPIAKLITIALLIPAILGYSRLVDSLRRYQLLYFFSCLYGILFFIFAYFLGHQTYGLPNTDTGPWRLLGWVFYFCIESCSPFLVSVFWAFANSITGPKAAKKNYTIMIAGSKLGGIIASLIALKILSFSSEAGQVAADIFNHQMLLLFSSAVLLISPVFIYLLMKNVPGRDLHGYEAAYKVEKKREGQEEKGMFAAFKGAISGLIVLIKYPYMLGVFGMLFFYEVINVVIGYVRLGVGQSSTNSLSELTSYLLTQAMYTHCVGFVIVLLGARTLVNLLGERRCLLMVPISTGILLIYYMQVQSANAIAIVYIFMRSINYAFANPLREVLYIPTVKEMKFKARSWIDAFGGRSAKATGSIYNMIIAGMAESGLFLVNGLFFASMIGLWTLNAYLVGRKFEWAIKNDKVIGSDSEL